MNDSKKESPQRVESSTVVAKVQITLYEDKRLDVNATTEDDKLIGRMLTDATESFLIDRTILASEKSRIIPASALSLGRSN